MPSLYLFGITRPVAYAIPLWFDSTTRRVAGGGWRVDYLLGPQVPDEYRAKVRRRVRLALATEPGYVVHIPSEIGLKGFTMLVRTRCSSLDPAMFKLAGLVRAGRLSKAGAYNAARDIARIRDGGGIDMVHNPGQAPVQTGVDVSTMWRREGRG